MKRLFEKSPLPLKANESCVVESYVEKCHGYFRGINIKLTNCSGITPARRMITQTRSLDMKVMVGSSCSDKPGFGITITDKQLF